MSRTDYKSALQAWQVARLQFEQADPEHIDAAIYRLQAAELRLRAELERARRERGVNAMPQVFWIGDVCDADWREKFQAAAPHTANAYLANLTVEAAQQAYEKEKAAIEATKRKFSFEIILPCVVDGNKEEL